MNLQDNGTIQTIFLVTPQYGTNESKIHVCIHLYSRCERLLNKYHPLEFTHLRLLKNINQTLHEMQ